MTLLANTAFLTVTGNLARMLECDFDENGQNPVLSADPSMRCWTGPHKVDHAHMYRTHVHN